MVIETFKIYDYVLGYQYHLFKNQLVYNIGSTILNKLKLHYNNVNYDNYEFEKYCTFHTCFIYDVEFNRRENLEEFIIEIIIEFIEEYSIISDKSKQIDLHELIKKYVNSLNISKFEDKLKSDFEDLVSTNFDNFCASIITHANNNSYKLIKEFDK